MLNHSSGSYKIFSEKLTFFTSCYERVRAYVVADVLNGWSSEIPIFTKSKELQNIGKQAHKMW